MTSDRAAILWNKLPTGVGGGIETSIVEFVSSDGAVVHGFTAAPSGVSARGGVVLLHHVHGWDEFYFETTERLARHGYDVICPDLYCRFGHGDISEIALQVREAGGTPDSTVIADCDSAAHWMKSRPTSNGKVAIMGACSGGRQAVLAASVSDSFNSVIDLWGGRVIMRKEELSAAQPVAPIDYTSSLSVPLLGIFGVEDNNPSSADVDAHEAALKANGKQYRFLRYIGAGHGFFHYHQDRYRPEAAMKAWDEIFAFLANTIG